MQATVATTSSAESLEPPDNWLARILPAEIAGYADRVHPAPYSCSYFIDVVGSELHCRTLDYRRNIDSAIKRTSRLITRSESHRPSGASAFPRR
jgi:hypothetical protein